MKINKLNIKTCLTLGGVSALLLGGFALAPASADDWGRDAGRDQRDLRFDRRDARYDQNNLRRDHAQVNKLDNRLENQVEHGRYGAAGQTERRIEGERRDIHHDQQNLRSDRRGIHQDKRDLRRDW